MLKTFIKSVLVVVFVASMVLATSHASLAEAHCTLNGQEVPCAELTQAAGKFVGVGIAFLVIFIAFAIWATVFWIMMIVHVASHPVPNKAMWIIIMVFTGLIGALVYYFVVKRHFVAPAPAAPAPTSTPPPAAA